MKNNCKNFMKGLLFSFGLFCVLTNDISLAEGRNTIRYRYVPLKLPTLPASFFGVNFNLLGDDGTIYGNVSKCGDIDCDFLLQTTHLATFGKGKLDISQSEFQVNAINSKGVAAGSATVGLTEEFPIFLSQAAFLKKNRVILIPPQQLNELEGSALAINDKGSFVLNSIALENGAIKEVMSLFVNDRLTPLNLTSGLVPSRATKPHINNHNFVAGTATKILPSGDFLFRSFRYDPQTSISTMLNPLSTETHALAMDMNSKGDVLGYSANFNGVERIGVWDKSGRFKTYFVEGTPEFPTSSNNLFFNDEGIIIITNVQFPEIETGLSYVVPKPRIRLNLADLVVNLPVSHSRGFNILDMNEKGDLLSLENGGYALLKRIRN